MSKTVAEEIRLMMQKVEEAMGRSYDMELEVENWEDPASEDDENWPAYRTLGINYSISGKYIPARIQYDDYDHPAEYPELDEVDVFDAETGQLLQNLPKHLDDEIEEAIWRDAEQRKKDDDYDPYDRYDNYR